MACMGIYAGETKATMVCGGKPTAGCVNWEDPGTLVLVGESFTLSQCLCTRPKLHVWILSDEALPACSQCVESRRTCPGYIQHFDLVVRDQTQSIRLKAKRKRVGHDSAPGPNPANPCHTHQNPSSSRSPKLWESIRKESRFDYGSYFNPIPQALVEDPVWQAINALIW